MSIGVAVCVLILIIWPKVNRVRSGDKVVVSSLLGSRFNAQTTTFRENLESECSIPEQTSLHGKECPTTFSSPITSTPVTASARRRISVQKDDPVPQEIETKIFDVQGILRSISKQCGDGRSLTEDEWAQLRQEVSSLNADLELVDLLTGDESINPDSAQNADPSFQGESVVT